MVDTSHQLGFPLQGGSSLAVTWRVPSVEMPPGTSIREAISIGYGGIASYDFHALETIQCMVERRKGGETGVEWLQTYRGDSFWKAHREGLWSSGEIAPFQILRMFAQSSLHRIAKDITKLFYEPLIIPNDKVVAAFLPKMIRLASQVPRYPCFSDLMASAMALGDRYPARSGIDDFTRLSF
jgi:hypothetical protein